MRSPVEYWIPQEWDPDEFKLPPMVLAMRDYANKDGWVTTATVETEDVTTGKRAYFGQTEHSSQMLTMEQKLDLLMSVVEHELREQLGMNPHKDGGK